MNRRADGEGDDLSRVVFVNVDRSVAKHISQHLTKRHRIESFDDSKFPNSSSQLKTIDAVLLGSDVKEPVNAVQRIHSVDKRVPIIILSGAAQCARLRQDLMFSPFVGHEIIVWPTTDMDGLSDVLIDAAQRRKQRLLYQDAAMANAHVQLEVLPLLHPETAEYIEGLFDHEPIGVLATTSGGKILKINRQARQIFGISDQAHRETSLYKLFPKSEKSRLESLLTQAVDANDQPRPELFELQTTKDKVSFVEVTAAPFSRPTQDRCAMLVVQEVTLRVQSERQRTEAVVELRLIANALRTLHSISTGNTGALNDKIRDFLHLGCEQFGLPIAMLSQVEGDKLSIVASVSDNKRFLPGATFRLENTFCKTTVQSSEPVAVERTSGTAWHDHPSYGECGIESYLGVRIIVGESVFGTLCFMSDAPHRMPFSSAEREILKLMSRWISGELQRERAEAHMRKLSSAIEQTADSVIITDRTGIVEYANPSYQFLTGYSRDEIVGSTAGFLQPEDPSSEELWTAINNGTDYRFLLSSKTKSGDLYHEQMTISPLKDDVGETTHLIATGQNVTALVEAKERDRKRQAELTHVARLSTLGGMVSGLAHELNQPLCAIMTYAQTCLRKMRAGEAELDDLQHGLTQIVRQAERADEIFSRIRDFSRKRQIRKQRANIREIVEISVGFIQTELKENNISVELKFPKKNQLVFADSIQIQQVLINLVRNSIDALASVESSRKKKISIKVSLEGRNFTKLTITDTGHGCPVEKFHRLFEPFYTTKEAGLGVGLSISQSIVDGHGGKLWLASSSPKGSTFCLTLPNWNNRQDATDTD
ncbi:histidine kinase [Hyphomicrobium methylovorum]|nr:histidine kinase [Hyphomicrobium methylovorum]